MERAFEGCFLRLRPWRGASASIVRRAVVTSAAASILTVLALAVPRAAHATDMPVALDSLKIKDVRRVRSGVARAKKRLALRLRDPGIVVPAAGSASDPSVHGAVLWLLATGGSGESATLELPQQGWSRVPSGAGADVETWLYRAKDTAKVKVALAAGELQVKLTQKAARPFGYSLDEASQGALAVGLDLGATATRLCAQASGASVLADAGGSDPGCDVDGAFVAKAAPAPAACADPSAGIGTLDVCTQEDLLDLLVDGQMQRTGIPGLAAAAVADGQVVWSRGYGLRTTQPARPATADTPFMLASISKAVIAVAVMQAVEDGRFALDDPISAIAGFLVDNPRTSGETITVRHLLTHTSGLADDEDVWGGYPGEADSLYVLGDSPIALGDFLASYYVAGGAWYDPVRNFLASPPGVTSEYSNIASALAAYLIEAVGPETFDDFCDARIFAPLAMNDTGWHLADFTPSDVAMPYESFGGSFYEWGLYGYPDYPDGQLRSSANDLGRFLAAISAGGSLSGVRILDETSVAEMLDVQLPAADPTQGLFWYYDTVAGRAVVGHNGGDYGVTTDMFFEPATGLGALVLTNTDDTGARVRAMQRIEAAIFELAETLAASPSAREPAPGAGAPSRD